jgi:hypothetical protein
MRGRQLGLVVASAAVVTGALLTAPAARPRASP